MSDQSKRFSRLLLDEAFFLGVSIYVLYTGKRPLVRNSEFIGVLEKCIVIILLITSF